MNALIYGRVSHESQDFTRQVNNLSEIAITRNWQIKRKFVEKASGTIKSFDRPEFRKMLDYIDRHPVDIVMVSEISRIGRRVTDILLSVEQLHEKGIALYVPQFNMLSFEDDRENPTVRLLLQMMAIGAQMEQDLRLSRQKEGIEIAKLKNVYKGRKTGSTADPAKLLNKYNDVVDLLTKSDLSLRRVAQISGRSINTVRKVKTFV